MTQSVEYAVSETVATVTLNRPDSLNSMNDELMRGIRDSVARIVEDESIRVLVLTGRGRGFCAGADLSNAAQRDPADTGAGSSEDFFNQALRAISTCPVPTIARINGPAAGGGMGLALSCDITIAARSAFFVATFGPRLGIVPDMGATWNIPRRVGRARALGITLLGDRISAEQAEAWGLIWQCVDDDELDQAVDRAAEVLRRSNPSTARRIRETVDAAAHNSFSDQLDLEMEHQAVLIPRNMQRAAQAFMEKREPEFGPERN